MKLIDHDQIAGAIAGHRRPVLFFSGGKDSLACLHLLRPHWDSITVLWVNTGALFPEMLELFHRVGEMVPHAIEIRTDQAAQIEREGFPVDLWPVTAWAELPTSRPGRPAPIALQPSLWCCRQNINFPLWEKAGEIGSTLAIQGTRADEFPQGQGVYWTGQEIQGIKAWYPIMDWPARQVYEYLAQEGIDLPPNYRQHPKSLGCWNCTGWLWEAGPGRVRWMKAHHPEKARELQRRLRLIEAQARQELDDLAEAIAIGEGQE